MKSIRPLRLGDVAELTELVQANREFLAPWSPLEEEQYYTLEGQREVVEQSLERFRQGVTYPMVIVDGPDIATARVVGRITLNWIVRLSFQSSTLGCWVGKQDNGRGLATAATTEVARLAFEELGLNRIEAATLLGNVSAQRVLERSGFTRIGMAPRYLKVAGEWQDHLLYQLLAPEPG